MLRRWHSYTGPLRAWSPEMPLHTWLQRPAAHLRLLSRRLVSHLQGLCNALVLCCHSTLHTTHSGRQSLWSLAASGAKTRLPALLSALISMSMLCCVKMRSLDGLFQWESNQLHDCTGFTWNNTQARLDVLKLASLPFSRAYPSHDHGQGISKAELDAFAASLQA